jgi:hypothetical protein
VLNAEAEVAAREAEVSQANAAVESSRSSRTGKTVIQASLKRC